MLIRNKKNILIGLLALIFLVVIYGLMFPRQELFVDDSLRVSEVPNPELERIVNMSQVKVNEQADQVTIESARRRSNQANMNDSGEELAAVMQESLNDEEESEPSLTSGALEDQTTLVSSRGQNDVMTREPVLMQQPLLQSPDSDVVLLTEGDGFVDLNLVEPKPIESVLIEGDEDIIDEVNAKLARLRSIEVTPPNKEDVPSAPESSGSNPFKVDSKSQSVPGEGQVSGVFVLPEVDEALMNGTDKISLDYQASYKKLKLIAENLKKADDENSDLKKHFDQVANENRRMAQMIRDIDEEIKALIVRK